MKRHHVLALLALVLPASAASAASADEIAPGFGSVPVPFPTGATIRNLSDGSFITCDGFRVRRWQSSGAFVATLGQFAAAGVVGAMVVDPSETFVLVGNATTGEMLRVELSVGQTLLANLPGNRDAAFESAASAIVSQDTCGTSCVSALVRLQTTTGATTSLVAAQGKAGPIAVDAVKTVYYGSPAKGNLQRFGAATLANPPPPAFQASGGLVVIEVESTPPVGDWKVETTFPGFTGDSYYRWNGPDLFGSPGVGVLSYEFEVTIPGKYIFHYHNRHEDPAPDQDNDAWVKVDGGPWLKIFSNIGAGSVKVWNWHSLVDAGGMHYEPNYDLSAGRHTVQISGRSNGFAIDRMVFYRPSVSQPMDLGHPESVSAAYNETDGQVVATGLTGPKEMVYEPEQGVFLLAEKAASVNRIRRFTPSGQGVVLVEGDPFLTLRNLDYTPQAGAGEFFSFQPPGNGVLAYSRTGSGGLNEHRMLIPKRPSLGFVGPGALTGLGPVAVTLQGGSPNGFAFFVIGPAFAVLPTELVFALPGSPPLFLGLLPSLSQLLTAPLAFDAAGNLSFTFTSAFGAPGVLGMQAVVLSPGGKVVGTSAPAIL